MSKKRSIDDLNVDDTAGNQSNLAKSRGRRQNKKPPPRFQEEPMTGANNKNENTENADNNASSSNTDNNNKEDGGNKKNADNNASSSNTDNNNKEDGGNKQTADNNAISSNTDNNNQEDGGNKKTVDSRRDSGAFGDALRGAMIAVNDDYSHLDASSGTCMDHVDLSSRDVAALQQENERLQRQNDEYQDANINLFGQVDELRNQLAEAQQRLQQQEQRHQQQEQQRQQQEQQRQQREQQRQQQEQQRQQGPAVLQEVNNRARPRTRPPSPGFVSEELAARYNMVELVPTSGVYVYPSVLSKVDRLKSATRMSRALLRMVLSPDALNSMTSLREVDRRLSGAVVEYAFTHFQGKRGEKTSAELIRDLRNLITCNNANKKYKETGVFPITDEEGLLAIAVWPMLKELVIHNNPLTTGNSGDPPLLKKYLQDRLGIQMVRKKADKTIKPPIQVPTKSHRKVKEIPKPLPKRPLQLMLEAGPDTPALPSSSFQPHPPQAEPRPPSQPLPPIQPSDVQPDVDVGDERLFEEKMTRTQSWTEDNFAKAREDEGEAKASTATAGAPTTAADADAVEPVFFTQVDDQGDEEEEAETDPPAADEQPKKDEKKAEKKRSKKRVDSAAYSMAVPNKFKGYEVFYDAPDDPEVPVAHDIQGNVRSLRLALKHPVNHRENRVDLERLQKPFQAYQKSKLPPKPPHQNKAEKLEEILEQMKDRLTVEEVNLAKILENKKKMKEEFPEVTDLLKEIQAKYKQVRNATVSDTAVQQQSVEDALKSLHNLGDKLKPSTQSTMKTTVTR